MKTDLEIQNSVTLLPINKVATKLNLKPSAYETYGKYKAKLNVDKLPKESKGKLILVTAINPTSLGEGKTTVSVGLADALALLDVNVCLALREPSLGPVFGIKGGAAGGGYAQLAPMEELNLHFTGDFNAITAANNLISSMIYNHIYFGNELNIDESRIEWKRCLDMNDRSLRHVKLTADGNADGELIDDGFTITAASEIMAILCLSKDIKDLKRRLSQIIVAFNKSGAPVTVKDLKCVDSLALLLKDAMKPNLIQTLEGTPCIVHGGPFANIAHGCNSVIATKSALALSDYAVTEAGFGADLGAEKFLDIKCRQNDLNPSCVVLVATVRALKYNGGVDKNNLSIENLPALKRGLCNLQGHIENLIKVFNCNVVVSINKFSTDTKDELNLIKAKCEKLGAEFALTDVFNKGSKGGVSLAKKVIKLCNKKTPELHFAYPLNADIKTKIELIAKKVYGAKTVEFSPLALKKINAFENVAKGLPVCIAKTQYSFSDNKSLLGRPSGYTFKVRDVELRAGAEFIVAIAGDIMLMPGLSRVPNAVKITMSDDYVITGLF